MNVVTTLKMDLSQPEQTQQVFCVQGDTFSRTVILELLAKGTVWTIPEGTSVLISYYKPDGTCGTYTHLPDGTQAWDINGNVITLVLTPHMLTAAGLVSAQLKLVCGEETISTFTFQIVVQPGIAPGDDPTNYTAWLTAYLPQTTDAGVGQYLKVSQVDPDGRVTGLVGKELRIPPDLTNRVQDLEDRAYDLENSVGNVSQLGNRVTSLERSTGEIQTLKNRIVNLEGAAGSIPQLNSRVGALEDGMQDAASLEARITALESGMPSYPAQWESALEDCIESIRDHQAYGGSSSVSFAYFSDHHSTGGCTGALISHVMEECVMPYSFFCGDMVAQQTYDDIKSVYSQIRQFNKMMSPVPREKDLRAIGEHDFCRTDSQGRRWDMDTSQIYEYLYRKQYTQNTCIPGDECTYFYIDDNIHKIRFIVLNSNQFSPIYSGDLSLDNGDDFGFGQYQIDWLINNALYFEEDCWSVVFITHKPLSNQGTSNLRDAHIIQGILTAFLERGTYEGGTDGHDSVYVDVDFQDAVSADVIGWFSGHTHNDSITTIELSSEPDLYSLPLNVVTIASDSDTGHAIDFVTVDKDLRTVFLTRLGNGENRSFTY